jgi:hypothetical protein
MHWLPLLAVICTARVNVADSYQAVPTPISQVTLEKYRYIRVGINVYDIDALLEYKALADSAAPSTFPNLQSL